MTAMKQEKKEDIRKAGPIDLDTCEPWAAKAKKFVQEVVVERTSIGSINKKPAKTSQPFASTLKLLIKTTTSKRLSRTKKHDGTGSASSSLNGDTSMSSGPASTCGHDDEAENEPPTIQYKEHVKSPLLKNTDTSLYDSRLISIMEDDGTTNRPAAKPFRQYQPLDGVVAL